MTSLLKFNVVGLIFINLVACQQETPVNENANTSTGAASTYNGPAARDSNVRAFETNL